MSDHLTDEDLDAIEACANAATPGPWEADGLEGNIDTPEHGTIIEVFSWSEADAEFIAAARTDVPALIAEVRRLQAQRREALALANAEVARWERDNHTPAVWAADIRDALEADDE